MWSNLMPLCNFLMRYLLCLEAIFISKSITFNKISYFRFSGDIFLVYRNTLQYFHSYVWVGSLPLSLLSTSDLNTTLRWKISSCEENAHMIKRRGEEHGLPSSKLRRNNLKVRKEFRFQDLFRKKCMRKKDSRITRRKIVAFITLAQNGYIRFKIRISKIQM